MNLKLVGIYLVRFLMRGFCLLPVKKKEILFCAYVGKNISCNPMYFNKYLLEQGRTDLCYLWAVKDVENTWIPPELNGRVRLIRVKSFAYFKALMTAGIVIYNLGLPMGSLAPKRKKQLWVQTWHGGGAFKAAGKDTNMTPVQKAVEKMTGKQIDIFLSSNQRFTDVFPEAVEVEASHFYNTGLPRNDMLFGDLTPFRKKVFRYFGIPEDKKILLYAPTFRGDFYHAEDNGTVEYRRILEALKERFGQEFVVLERKHYAVKPEISEGVYPASDYPDMQELLAAADVLITDYSSSMWDFALTGKPGFLYTPDLKHYTQERDFYMPIETWPYPYAETLDTLIWQIQTYDPQKGEELRNTFFRLVNSYENGTACRQLKELLKL
mgnify:CR=1 FL=1